MRARTAAGNCGGSSGPRPSATSAAPVPSTTRTSPSSRAAGRNFTTGWIMTQGADGLAPASAKALTHLGAAVRSGRLHPAAFVRTVRAARRRSKDAASLLPGRVAAVNHYLYAVVDRLPTPWQRPSSGIGGAAVVPQRVDDVVVLASVIESVPPATPRTLALHQRRRRLRDGRRRAAALPLRHHHSVRRAVGVARRPPGRRDRRARRRARLCGDEREAAAAGLCDRSAARAEPARSAPERLGARGARAAGSGRGAASSVPRSRRGTTGRPAAAATWWARSRSWCRVPI